MKETEEFGAPVKVRLASVLNTSACQFNELIGCKAKENELKSVFFSVLLAIRIRW